MRDNTQIWYFDASARPLGLRLRCPCLRPGLSEPERARSASPAAPRSAERGTAAGEEGRPAPGTARKAASSGETASSEAAAAAAERSTRKPGIRRGVNKTPMRGLRESDAQVCEVDAATVHVAESRVARMRIVRINCAPTHQPLPFSGQRERGRTALVDHAPLLRVAQDRVRVVDLFELFFVTTCPSDRNASSAHAQRRERRSGDGTDLCQGGASETLCGRPS